MGADFQLHTIVDKEKQQAKLGLLQFFLFKCDEMLSSQMRTYKVSRKLPTNIKIG